MMRSSMAAAYVDEVSVEAFVRRVESVYSLPLQVPGRGKVWLKVQLDRDIRKLSAEAADFPDAAQLL